MADYYFPTVVQQLIPNADMTPLEHLILSRIFDAEPDGDGLYFFIDTGPCPILELPAASLKAAFAESTGIQSWLRDYLAGRMATIDESQTHVEIDISGTSWEFFLQDIVRRSRTLKYVTVVTAFTCTKMRPDGFGGMATLITADAIKGKSTNDILEDFLGEMETAAPPAG